MAWNGRHGPEAIGEAVPDVYGTGVAGSARMGAASFGLGGHEMVRQAELGLDGYGVTRRIEACMVRPGRVGHEAG